ncbi:unnamed protein product [Calypogeia fissa]
MPAALAFTYLAMVQGDVAKRTIVEVRALAGLVGALSNEDNPKLQEIAALAIQTLATGQDSIKFQIVSEESMLVSLAKPLSKEENPAL